VSNLAAPGSDCALWSAQAYDAATNALLGRYALSAEYGETESSFTISYFRNVDVTRDRTAIPQTEDTFTEQTPYRYDDAGNAFREEIDVNTAITILADLLLTDAGPIDTSEGFGIVSYKTKKQKGYHTLGGGTKKPRAGQPGGGNQTFPRCPNGCSGPVNLPFPNTGAMNYCCDIHDLCYTIGGDRAYKNQCDADLRSCLSQVTPGWSKIVGHLLPPFVTPEIGRWFREHFADKAFRWTNEPQTCFSWVFFLSWCCYDTKPQDVPTMTYGCDNSIYPSNCLFHKAGIPGQTQPDDWWFACINRSYSSWPTSAASNFTPIDSSAAAACSSCGNAVSLTADSSSIKDSGPVPFDNGGQCVASCGNGQIDAAAGEECDSENLAGQTCQSKGFIAGQLGCTSNCSFDTSNCLRASTYEIWKAAKFSPAQQADPAVSGPSADPDNDRVVNILEYLSNSDPLVPTNLGDILQYYFYRNTTDNKDYFTLKVKRNKNATDAVYKPAAENSIMGPWDYAFYGDTYVQNIDGNSEWVFYRDKVSKDSVAMRLFKLDVAKTSTPAMKVGLMTNPNPTRVYYRLTVTKTGQGLVTSASGQINCGEACFAESAQGTSEALTALASSGFKFDGWSGVCSGTGACTVTSDAAQQVGAAFSRIAFCGDGAKNGVEECDGQDLGGYSCLSFGGYVGGELGCTSLCRYDQSRCLMQICGNNAIEGTEQCDGSSLTGKTCAAVDPQEPRGTLSCSNGCQFDTSACCSDWKIRPAAGACGIAQCRAWEKCFMRT
ncbi:MAG: hypothetical protein NT033_04915, partial [Candidatus Omnitrophica bacterium]|nr:hypothetical protein [Candidatus Omnitrophota bacterium]